jgi:hypothetical protein
LDDASALSFVAGLAFGGQLLWVLRGAFTRDESDGTAADP